MEHYRRTAHTRYDNKFHLAWITKYRKKLLEVDILKGHVSVDHVHLFVSCPPAAVT